MEKTQMIKDYQSWAKKKKVLADTSASLYGTYLNYLKKEDYFGNKFEEVFKRIEAFYEENDTLYALTYCNILFEDFKDTSEEYPQKNSEWSNSRSAIVKLLSFLSSKGITCNSGDDEERDKIRKEINKPKIHKIDGIEGLVSKLGIRTFVQMAIEQSYFIHPSVVVKRHEELVKLFDNNNILDARKSQNEDKEKQFGYRQEPDDKKQYHFLSYKDDKVEYDFLIKPDKNGNAPVRSIINQYTGYTMCGGEDSIFQNYIISHIWGHAFDPRYFTSLWNVVIIPAWANPLMDKIQPEEGSPASILQSTFMAICHKLYFEGYPYQSKTLKVDDWTGIRLIEQPPILCSKDIMNNKTYIINLLYEKEAGVNVGKINNIQISL